MLKSCVVACAGLAAVVVAPVAASADTYVSPNVTIAFGGDADDARPGFAGNVAFMGRGIGLEIDVAHTPDFFEGVDIATYSAGYIAGGDANTGGWKPFGAAAITLMRASADGFDAENKFAFNLAGGAVGLINDTVGWRAEIRYFRRLEDDVAGFIPLEDEVFDFFRAGFGVVFRF